MKTIRTLCLFFALCMLLSSASITVIAAELPLSTQSSDIEMRSQVFCERCMENGNWVYAPLVCTGSYLIFEENITYHTALSGTCYYLVYMSHSKYRCKICGWSELRFVDDDPSTNTLAKHYCDEYHDICGPRAACDMDEPPEASAPSYEFEEP